MHRILPFRPWQQARCTAATGRPRSVGQILLSVRMSTVPARQRSDGETSARAGGESRPTQKKRRRSVAPDSHRGSRTPLSPCCMAGAGDGAPVLQKSAARTPLRGGFGSLAVRGATASEILFLTSKNCMLSVSLAYTSHAVARLLRSCPSREKWRAMTHGALQVPSRDRTPTLGVRVNAGEVAFGAPYSDRAAALGRADLHEHFSRRRREHAQKRSSVAPDRRHRAARGSLTPLPSVSGDWWAGGTASPKASVQGRPAQGWHSRPRFAPSSHPARASFPASR